MRKVARKDLDKVYSFLEEHNASSNIMKSFWNIIEFAETSFEVEE
jgi:hypothetical protein